jgi:2-(1,2-epoxy-1,2-dihydrophenyl)acetyl-CoA isomerase
MQSGPVTKAPEPVPGVRVSINGPTAEVVLDRPDKLNALDDAALAGLRFIFEDLASRVELRAVLLRGEGRAFCAGRDVVGVDPATDDARSVLADQVHPVLRAIQSVPVPVVAAVQGACLGIGLGLLASSDIVYASPSTKIGTKFARLGAVLDSGGHAFLIDRLGPHRTMDLIVTGELLDGAEAARLGLVSRVVGEAELLSTTRSLVDAIAVGPTASFVRSKAIITALRGQRGFSDSILELEADAQGAVGRTADYSEGFAAFRERREPRFIGR